MAYVQTYHPKDYNSGWGDTVKELGRIAGNAVAQYPMAARQDTQWQRQENEYQAQQQSKDEMFTDIYNATTVMLEGTGVDFRPPREGETIEQYTLYADRTLTDVVNKSGDSETARNVLRSKAEQYNLAKTLNALNKSDLSASVDRFKNNLQGRFGSLSQQAQPEQGSVPLVGNIPSTENAAPSASNRFDIPYTPNDPHISNLEQARMNLPQLENDTYGSAGGQAPAGEVNGMIQVQGAGQATSLDGQISAKEREIAQKEFDSIMSDIDYVTTKEELTELRKRYSELEKMIPKRELARLEEEFAYNRKRGDERRDKIVDNILLNAPNAPFYEDGKRIDIVNPSAVENNYERFGYGSPNYGSQARLTQAAKPPSPLNLYSANQTGTNLAQTNFEQARQLVIDLEKQYRAADANGDNTTEIRKNLEKARDNLTTTSNMIRSANEQSAYLGKTDPNIQGYTDNITASNVADLNRGFAVEAVSQLPLGKDGHGRLTLDGKPLFSNRDLNPALRNRLFKQLEDAARGHNLTDNDKIQILGETIELLRAQNIQSLKESAASSGGKKR